MRAEERRKWSIKREERVRSVVEGGEKLHKRREEEERERKGRGEREETAEKES